MKLITNFDDNEMVERGYARANERKPKSDTKYRIVFRKKPKQVKLITAPVERATADDTKLHFQGEEGDAIDQCFELLTSQCLSEDFEEEYFSHPIDKPITLEQLRRWWSPWRWSGHSVFVTYNERGVHISSAGAGCPTGAVRQHEAIHAIVKAAEAHFREYCSEQADVVIPESRANIYEVDEIPIKFASESEGPIRKCMDVLSAGYMKPYYKCNPNNHPVNVPITLAVLKNWHDSNMVKQGANEIYISSNDDGLTIMKGKIEQPKLKTLGGTRDCYRRLPLDVWDTERWPGLVVGNNRRNKFAKDAPAAADGFEQYPAQPLPKIIEDLERMLKPITAKFKYSGKIHKITTIGPGMYHIESGNEMNAFDVRDYLKAQIAEEGLITPTEERHANAIKYGPFPLIEAHGEIIKAAHLWLAKYGGNAISKPVASKLGGKGNCWLKFPLPPKTNGKPMTAIQKIRSFTNHANQASVFDYNAAVGNVGSEPVEFSEIVPRLEEMLTLPVNKPWLKTWETPTYKFDKVEEGLFHLEHAADYFGKPTAKANYSLIQIVRQMRFILDLHDVKLLRYTQQESAIRANKLLIGISNAQNLSKRDRDLRDAIGDAHTAVYRNIADDHDMRIVNNTYATTDTRIMTSNKPNKALLGEFEGLETTTVQFSQETVGDPDVEFLLDVATMKAYGMVLADDYNCSDEVLERLRKQPDIAPPKPESAGGYLTYNAHTSDYLTNDIVYIIGPVINNDTKGVVDRGVAHYRLVEGTLHWAGRDTSRTRQIGWCHALLSGSRSVDIPNTNMEAFVLKRHYVNGLQIVATTSIAHDALYYQANEIKTFDLPTFKPDWLLSDLKINRLTISSYTLNRELMNRLLNKNITLTVGDAAMQEYAMALSWYSYNKRGVELANQKITMREIRPHLYVAKVLLMRDELLTKLSEHIATPGITRAAVALLAALTNLTLSEINVNETLEKVVNAITGLLTTPNLKNQLGEVLDGWETIDLWANGGRINTLKRQGTAVCLHHRLCAADPTGRPCICCGSLTAKENGYCTHCKSDERCYHKLNDGIDEGENNCDCCGRKNKDEICRNCRLEPEIIVGDKQERRYTPAAEHATKLSLAQGRPEKRHKKVWEWRRVGETMQFVIRHDIARVIDADAGLHEHTCAICNKVYTHLHPFNSAEHPQFVGDCPNCGTEQVNELLKSELDAERVEYLHKIAKELQAGPRRKGRLADDPVIVKEHSSQGDRKREGGATIKVNREVELPRIRKAELNTALTPNSCEYFTTNGTHSKEVLVGNANKFRHTTIPFLLAGEYEIGSFEVYDVQDVTDRDCGYDSASYYLHGNMSQMKVESAIHKSSDLSEKDLHKIMNIHEENSVVVFTGFVSVRVANDSDEFAVFIHANSIDDELKKEHNVSGVNHWLVGRLKWREDPTPFGARHVSAKEHDRVSHQTIGKSYALATRDQQAYLSFILADMFRAEIVSKIPLPKIQNGAFTNDIGNPSTSQRNIYKIPINGPIGEYLIMLNDAINSGTVPEGLQGVWDLTLGNATEIDTHLKNSARDICLNIARLFSEPSKLTTTHKLPTTTVGNVQYVDVSQYKIKPGDIVFVRGGGKVYPQTVDPMGGKVALTVHSKSKTMNLNIMIPKSSFMSAIIRLAAINKSMSNSKYVIDSLNNPESYYLEGYGGSGKTTEISKVIKEMLVGKPQLKIAVTACTSSGVQAMSRKLGNAKVTVCSFERLTTMVNVKWDVIVLDESTMIKPWELALIIFDKTRLILMGDTTQVGGEDFSVSGGSHEEYSLLNYVKSIKMPGRKLTKVYRFGKDLVEKLVEHPALSDMECGSEDDTRVDLEFTAKPDVNLISQLFYDCDVVLVFYNAHKEMLNRILPSGTRVETVAKYQGLEASKVGVYQASLSGNTTTHLNFKHCVSAATRAKSHLVWLSVGCFGERATLAKRLGYTLGSIGLAGMRDDAFLSTVGHSMEKIRYVARNIDKANRDAETIVIWSDDLPNIRRIELLHKTANWNNGVAKGLIVPNGKLTGKYVAMVDETAIKRKSENKTVVECVIIECEDHNTIKDKLLLKSNRFLFLFYACHDSVFTVIIPSSVMKFTRPDKLIEIPETVDINDLILKLNNKDHIKGRRASESLEREHGILERLIVDNVIDEHWIWDKYESRFVKNMIDGTIIYNSNNKMHRRIGSEFVAKALNGTKFSKSGQSLLTQSCTFEPNFQLIDSFCVKSVCRNELNIYIATRFENTIKSFQFADAHGVNQITITPDEISCAKPTRLCVQVLACIGLTCYPYDFEIINPTVPPVTYTVNKTVLNAEPVAAGEACLEKKTIHPFNMKKIDVSSVIKHVENNGKEFNTKVQFHITKDVVKITISGSKMFVSKTFFIEFDRNSTIAPMIVETNMTQHMQSDVIMVMSNFSYLEEKDLELTESYSKLNRKGRSRVRILAHVAKIMQANEEPFILKGALAGWVVETSASGCAACTGIVIKERRPTGIMEHLRTAINRTIIGKATIESDYTLNESRHVVGNCSEFIAEVLNRPGTLDIIDGALDDMNLSQAILIERISTAIDDAIIRETTFTKSMRSLRYKNDTHIGMVRRAVGRQLDNNGYDDVTYYPIWEKNAIEGKLTEVVTRVKGTIELVTEKRFNKNATIREACSELVADQQKRWISVVIAKGYINRLGAMDRLPGMIESISWHKANSTKTFTNIADRLTQQQVKAMSLERPPIYVPNEVAKILQDKYEMDFISSNHRESGSCPFRSAADVACSLTVVNTHGNVYLHLPTSYCTYVTGNLGSNVAPTSGTKEAMAYKLNKPIYKQMLKAHLARLKADSEDCAKLKKEFETGDEMTVGNDVAQKNGVHLFGPESLSQDYSSFEPYIKAGAKVYVWCPMQITQHGNIKVASMNNSDNIFEIKKEYYQSIVDGVKLPDGINVLHTSRTVADVLLLEISADPWLEPTNRNSKYVVIEVPKFIISPDQILRQKHLYEKTKLLVNHAFLMNMQRRAQKPNTSLKDLKVQARTLINVAQFGTSTVSSQYGVKVATGNQVALVAYWTQKAFDENYKLMEIADDESIVMHTLKQSAWNIGAKVADQIATCLTYDTIALLLQEYISPCATQRLLYETVRNLKEMHWRMKDEERKYVDNKSSMLGAAFNVNAMLQNQLKRKTRDQMKKPGLIDGCKACSSNDFKQLVGNFVPKIAMVSDIEINEYTIIEKAGCNHPAAKFTIVAHDTELVKETHNSVWLTYSSQSVKQTTNLKLKNWSLEGQLITNLIYDDQALLSDIGEYGMYQTNYEQMIFLINEMTPVLADALTRARDSVIVTYDEINALKYLYNASNRVLICDRTSFQKINGKSEKEVLDYLEDEGEFNQLYTLDCDGSVEPNDMWTKVPGARTNENTTKIMANSTCDSDELFKEITGRRRLAIDNDVLRIASELPGGTTAKYRNLLVKFFPMSWGTNVNLTSINPHFIDNATEKGTHLSAIQLQFLEYFNAMLMGEKTFVNHLSDEVTINTLSNVHIYTFDYQMTRTVPTHLEGVHIVITTVKEHSRTEKQCGVNYLVFSTAKFGRMGASLRIIAGALMINHVNSVQFHEARPLWSSIWAENVARIMFEKNDQKGGVIINTLSGTASSLGHTIWCGQMSAENRAIIIRSNLQFGDVYGMDEASIERWPVKHVYCNPHTTVIYSNLNMSRSSNYTVAPLDNSIQWCGINIKDVGDCIEAIVLGTDWNLERWMDPIANYDTRRQMMKSESDKHKLNFIKNKLLNNGYPELRDGKSFEASTIHEDGIDNSASEDDSNDESDGETSWDSTGGHWMKDDEDDPDGDGESHVEGEKKIHEHSDVTPQQKSDDHGDGSQGGTKASTDKPKYKASKTPSDTRKRKQVRFAATERTGGTFDAGEEELEFEFTGHDETTVGANDVETLARAPESDLKKSKLGSGSRYIEYEKLFSKEYEDDEPDTSQNIRKHKYKKQGKAMDVARLLMRGSIEGTRVEQRLIFPRIFSDITEMKQIYFTKSCGGAQEIHDTKCVKHLGRSVRDAWVEFAKDVKRTGEKLLVIMTPYSGKTQVFGRAENLIIDSDEVLADENTEDWAIMLTSLPGVVLEARRNGVATTKVIDVGHFCADCRVNTCTTGNKVRVITREYLLDTYESEHYDCPICAVCAMQTQFHSAKQTGKRTIADIESTSKEEIADMNMELKQLTKKGFGLYSEWHNNHSFGNALANALRINNEWVGGEPEEFNMMEDALLLANCSPKKHDDRIGEFGTSGAVVSYLLSKYLSEAVISDKIVNIVDKHNLVRVRVERFSSGQLAPSIQQHIINDVEHFVTITITDNRNQPINLSKPALALKMKGKEEIETASKIGRSKLYDHKYALIEPALIKDFKIREGKVVFNPQVTFGCVKECLKQILTQEGRVNTFTTNRVLGKVPLFASNIEAIKAAFCLGINLHVHALPSQDVSYTILVHDGPIHVIKPTIGPAGEVSGHAMLLEKVPYSMLMKSTTLTGGSKTLEDVRAIIKPKGDSELIEAINEFEANINTKNQSKINTNRHIDESASELILSARRRVFGAYDVVLSKKNFPQFINWKTVTLKGRNKYIAAEVPELMPNRVYLFGGAQGLVAQLTFSINGITHVLHRQKVGYCMAFDPGLNLAFNAVNMRTTKSESGVLNFETHTWCVSNMPEYASLPINLNGISIIVAEYDGSNHHGRPERDCILKNAETGVLRFPSLNAEEVKVFRDLMHHDGPIRIALSNGRLQLTSCCMLKEHTELLDEWLVTRGLIDIDEMRRLVASAAGWGWTNVGNRKRPIVRDLPYHDSLTGKKWKELIVEVGITLQGNALLDDVTYRLTKEEWSGMIEPIWTGHGRRYNDISAFQTLEWSVTGKGVNERTEPMTIFAKIAGMQKGVEQNMDEVISVDDLATGDAMMIGLSKRIGNVSEKQLELSESQRETLPTIDAINCLAIDDWQAYPDVSEEGNEGGVRILVGNGEFENPVNVEVSLGITCPTTINYWDDETAMVENEIPLPRNNINLRGGENVTGIKIIEKSVMTEYPSHGQPNYTQRAGAGLAAVSELFGSKIKLRQVEHDPVVDAELFMSTYTTKGSVNALPQINISYNDMIEWLKERPDGTKICAEVEEILSEGWDIHGLDRVNVHMKLESRMKDVMMHSIDNIGMPGTIAEQRNRLIVWQRKGITAIFGPVFLKAKEHLKRVLKENVVYADGLTPMQLSAICNRITSENITFAEDDLKKQDRQTDHTLIKTEMEVYKRLGVNPGIVEIWSNVHKNWKAKGLGYKFDGDASRHTGQCTTAIGNVIVNLMVKRRLVSKLGNDLKMMFVLGDDNAIMTTGYITESEISLNSARHFNMQSEPLVDKVCATFLRMIIYKSKNGNLSLGPDIVRLKRKFEVLNGVSESTDDNIIMRSMSYCCMLGGLKPVMAIIVEKGWPIKPAMWYEYDSLIEATAHKYKCNANEIENELNLLLQMIRECKVRTIGKLMFVSKMT
jgi:hypothetical protein